MTTLNKDTIQFLQNQSIVESLTEKTKATNEPVVVLPEGYNVSSLDCYMNHLTHYSGVFKTSSVAAFCDYANKFAVDKTFAYIDTGGELSGSIIFDAGTVDAPMHKKHRAKVSLYRLPAFAKIHSIYEAFVGSSRSDAHRFSQRDLADFIIDWASDITLLGTDEKEMTIAEGSAFARNVTLEQVTKANSSVGNYSAELTGSERIALTSTERELASIIFNVPPYLDFIGRNFELRVQSTAARGESGVAFTLRPMRYEQTLVEIENEFVELLTENLGDEFTPILGEFSD